MSWAITGWNLVKFIPHQKWSPGYATVQIHAAVIIFVNFAGMHHYLNCTTACTVANSIVHSILDYCSSYYNLPRSQKTRVQQIYNSLARAIVKAPEFSHATPILRAFHWLKTNVLNISSCHLQSPHNHSISMHDLITVQPSRNTRPSSVVTLSRQPISSFLRITDRSFRYDLPLSLKSTSRYSKSLHRSQSISDSPLPTPVTSFSCCFTTLNIYNSFTLSPPT